MEERTRIRLPRPWYRRGRYPENDTGHGERRRCYGAELLVHGGYGFDGLAVDRGCVFWAGEHGFGAEGWEEGDLSE